MQYTVKEIAELTGVTIKTLHHYHKIGLLVPFKMTEAGYRLYGAKELERLQQILFYRELDFSLTEIKKALQNESSRMECLTKQQKLLIARRQRMDCLLNTIEQSIMFAKKGEPMEKSAMFKGLNKEEWTQALKDQNEYLKDKYKYDMLEANIIQTEQLNEQAKEAQDFMNKLITALRNGWKAHDKRVQKALEEHIEFLNRHGIAMDSRTFLNVCKFQIEDDFHREMLEGQQLGLSYYIYTAAEMYSSLS